MTDLGPHDSYPELCWRCDVYESDSGVGLCELCLHLLRGDLDDALVVVVLADAVVQ